MKKMFVLFALIMMMIPSMGNAFTLESYYVNGNCGIDKANRDVIIDLEYVFHGDGQIRFITGETEYGSVTRHIGTSASAEYHVAFSLKTRTDAAGNAKGWNLYTDADPSKVITQSAACRLP